MEDKIRKAYQSGFNDGYAMLPPVNCPTELDRYSVVWSEGYREGIRKRRFDEENWCVDLPRIGGGGIDTR